MNFFKRGGGGTGGATGPGEGVEADVPRVFQPEVKIPIVRCKEQPRRHKVIAFGYMVTIPEESDEGDVRTVVPDVYKFQYPPVPEVPDDLVPGVIPANFQAGVEVDEKNIFFETREGDNGPEYR